ncbi:MAG: ABC transporter substrate-binding protein [Firmicutes bacterium]|nr:ABC transporter substrate-binding protein [Bacillota bacterium]
MKKLKNPAVLVLAMLLLAALSLCGCGQAEDLTTVRVNEVTHSIFYAPFYVAMQQGYFAEEGIEIELVNGGGSDKSMTALLSGQADVGLMGPETAVYVKNEGRENHAVIVAQLTKKDGSFLLGKEPDEDFSWEKLAGTSVIGGRSGGMPEMTLEYVLKQQGMTPNVDVTVRTDVQFDLMGGAFIAGEDDYVTMFEPSASTMELAGEGYIVASVGEAAGDAPFTCFMVTKDYLSAQPELVEAFVRAVYKGQQYVQSHSAQEIAGAILESFPDSEPELIATVVQRYLDIDVWKSEPMMVEEDYERLLAIIREAGIIEEAPEMKELVENSIGEALVK